MRGSLTLILTNNGSCTYFEFYNGNINLNLYRRRLAADKSKLERNQF